LLREVTARAAAGAYTPELFQLGDVLNAAVDCVLNLTVGDRTAETHEHLWYPVARQRAVAGRILNANYSRLQLGLVVIRGCTDLVVDRNMHYRSIGYG